MTVDLILHGVPNGQDIWGVSDDTHYFSTFYAQKDEKELLNIDVRKVSGKSYCYYNYLKYNGVTASDGRAGAYLGITLRFDAYYKDVINIYHLCEIIYNNLIDKIFIKNDNNVKFKIAKFKDAENELNEIRKKVLSFINLSATAKDFTAINDSFFKNEGKVVKAFLLDCTFDNVMQALIKYGKVEISKHFPSVNEAKRVKSVEERLNATITQKEAELQSIGKHIKELNDEQNKLKSELQNQKKKIEKLNNDVSERELIIKSNEEAVKQTDTLKKDAQKLKKELETQKCEISKLNGIISNKENIIKSNEKTVKESDTLKKESQELKDRLQKKEQEIERLKAELVQYKDSGKLSELVQEIKVPLCTLAEVAGRQLTTFPNDNATNNSEADSTAETESNECYKENKNFWSTPIWQIAKVVLLVLTLCSSIYCVCKLSFSQNCKATIVQTEKSSFIKDVETTEKKMETNYIITNENCDQVLNYKDTTNNSKDNIDE